MYFLYYLLIQNLRMKKIYPNLFILPFSSLFISFHFLQKKYKNQANLEVNNNKFNSIMIHEHNHSTLLGGHRRAVYYPPDGTGRDNYIRTDNGGTNIVYKCQGVPELGNYMKFGPSSRTYKPASSTRFQKYASDGTGRDKYVVSHQGGQYNEEEENSALLVKFRNTMRDGGWRKPSKSMTQEFYRPSQIKATQEMSRTQLINNRRLSEPKRRAEKYSDKLEALRHTFYKV